MKFNIAVAQIEIERMAPAKNLEKAEKYIAKASEKGAGVVIFPEDFVTDPLVDRLDMADADFKYRDHFQLMAKKYNIDIIPGSFIEKDDSGHYNTTYYIKCKGEVLARYRKINLWLPERDYITPGNRVSVFDTRFGKAALIICWDMAFPEMLRKVIKQGAKIVYCPSYWCYGDAGHGIQIDPMSQIKLVDAMCTVRAFENEVVFVYCNAAGEFNTGKRKDTILGHSQVTIPFKGPLKKLDHKKEEMFFQKIDLTVLDIAEESKRIRQDLLNRVIH